MQRPGEPLKTSMDMTLTNLRSLLQASRNAIVDEWLYRLQTEVSPRYSGRPREELTRTISAAADANFHALLNNDFSQLDEVIEYIGQLRGRAGFRLSEVQKAFELFRKIMFPIIERRMDPPEAFSVLERLNECLAYTIPKFSDQFQELHESEIKKHARKLEITVRKRTKQLAESERKYRQLVEEIRDGYFVHQNERIVFANQAFCDMHGYTLADVIGRHFQDFVAPESLDELMGSYRERVVQSHGEGQYVYLRLNKTGERFPTENKVIHTVYQGEAAVIGICRDITKRMAIEKRVREAERLAHIGQLTTSIAHEIRNPLSSASMSIQDLLKSLSVSGNDKRRIEILGKEIARVNRILTEMLDFAKPMKLDVEKTSIGPLVQSCLEVLEAKIREKGISVRIKLARKLPRILVDREKIFQALINVFLNSIEAVAMGGDVTVSATHLGGAVRIEIVDDGQGIAEEDLKYIFDPFFSRKKKGTGLGLANAKKVVEAHGGKIEVRTPVSSGTAVTIDIPIARQSAVESRT